MFQKVFTNGVAISYGPSLPSTAVADGTIFYKTVSSAGFPAGFYLYGTRQDTNPNKFGPQVGQQWYAADAGDLYLRITGGVLTGSLGLTNYLSLTGASAAQRILIGNVSAGQPVVINSQSKILSFGLGSTFDQNGGTMTSILKADFNNLTSGLTWNSQKVWHAGNDGSGSSLDADTVDTYHANKDNLNNTIPVRDSNGHVKVTRIQLLADDSGATYSTYPIVDFVTTRGDGLSIRSKVSFVKEVIRTNTHADGINRQTWNININGNAGSASNVTWNNVTNKPTWINDGVVNWDDITGKPDAIKAFNFTLENASRASSALEMTSNGTKDIFSGLWIGENVLDMPKNSNTFNDPNDTLPHVLNNANFYWAGFQTLKGPNNASGVQMVANWNAEDIDTNNNGETFEDNRSLLMYRVNDDSVNGRNNTTWLNGFSPWIKVWTNLSLTSLAQLKNDPGFITGASLDSYIKLTSTVQQVVSSDVAWTGTFNLRTVDNTKGLIFNKGNGEVFLSGGASFTTTSGHFQSTGGNLYTGSGNIYTDSGAIGTGGVSNNGGVYLQTGRSGYTGQVIFTTNNARTTWQSRIFVDNNAKAMCYMLGEGNIDMGANAYHLFNKTIKSTGDVVAYASDKRLKKNIQPIQDAVLKVKNLGGYLYDWDLDKCEAAKFTPSNPTEHGLIAQEVLEIVPDAVAESAIGNGFLTVKYERIVPLLTAAISEQATKLDEQAQKIQHLEDKIELLMKMVQKLA